MKPFITFLIFTSAAAFAQSPRVDTLVSPEVHPDRRVTFRVRATNAAEVTLFGDWMVPETKQAMTRDEQGVWSVTVGPLEPGLAIYTFTVNGVTTPDPVNPRIKLRARTSASLVDVPGNPPMLWEARDVPHGKVEVTWEKSRVTGDTRAYYVYTPPGYKPSGGKRHPVLYLLHGNNDTAAGWTDVGKANFILDNLIAEKKARPMIVVMPWGHAVPYSGPQSNNTALVERYLIEEVMPQVEKKYRIARGRENCAVVGLSMGGGHALHIGLSHLDRFSAVAAFSSAVPRDLETRFKSLLADPNATNKKLKLLWIGCGRQDSAFQRNQKLSELLTDHKIRNTFHPTEGLHNFAIWRQYLVEVAPLLFREDGGHN
jgi:enterochelin esterase-like enzyme